MLNHRPPERNQEPDRILLEHELRAAIRIIGYLAEQNGGEITVPRRVLGIDYRVGVTSDPAHHRIVFTSRIGNPES